MTNAEPTDELTGFWTRVERNRTRLREMPCEEAVDWFYDAIQTVDERLGIEIGDLEDEPAREVVITAYGDPEAFGAIDALLALAPQWHDWRFVGLKPAAGFDFVLETDDGHIDIEQIRFLPVLADEEPDLLALCLFIPNLTVLEPSVDRDKWQILATGLGERACARIDEVHVLPLEEATAEARPIVELPDYLREWASTRN